MIDLYKIIIFTSGIINYDTRKKEIAREKNNSSNLDLRK